MVFPDLFDPNWKLRSFGDKRVYDTFKSDCVFLSRLNELDEGKCTYLGISRAGITYHYRDFGRTSIRASIDNHGWLIINAK